MTDYIIAIEGWSALLAGAIVLVLVLVTVRLLAGRRRRIEIARPTLDDAPPSPTLARTVAVPVERRFEPAPLTNVEATNVAAVGGPSDDLTRMKGVGPKLAGLLGTLGVTRFDQIAAWTDADIVAIDARLGSFAGRARRDRWVEQAALLTGGDLSAYEARFGKLGGPPE